MGKIKHIILREYLTRVRKKSFIIMTLLGPILFAALMVAPMWLAKVEDSDLKTVGIAEFHENGSPVKNGATLFDSAFKNTDKLKFTATPGLNIDVIKTLAQQNGFYGFLVINHSILNSTAPLSVDFYGQSQPSLGIERQILTGIEQYLQNYKLAESGISREKLEHIRAKVQLNPKMLKLGQFEEQKNIDIKRGIGYAASLLIYMFILFFGSQVMRGVIEEKTNRIIEVVISSVKPFQLMMGKIVGIGMVGLTQFAVWIVLSGAISGAISSFIVDTPERISPLNTPTELTAPIKSADNLNTAVFKEYFDGINIRKILLAFIFYFLGGFLLYSSMFAAIGSMIDTETDTQQFMLPVTIPLIISILVMSAAVTNPNGQVAYWFSIIPFTSPIVMMARIPFEPGTFDILLSGIILVATFMAMTLLSAKIYRTNILLYGKKVSFKEIFKQFKA